MTIQYNDDSAQIIWPVTDCHDVSSKKDYVIYYRPNAHSVNKSYIKDVSIIIPSVDNGCMYVCTSSGISGATAPTWGTDEGKITTDGTVSWKCLAYNARLFPGDSITLSTWTPSTGVITDTPTILTTSATTVRVTDVVTTSKTFTLTNHITVTRVSGRTEEFSKTIVITIKAL